MSDSTGFIPFALPSIGTEEIAEVAETLAGGWLTTGPRCAQFEEDFRAYLGTPAQTIAVNSATAGLHLALEAAGVRRGDKVIVPTWTFTATAEVVRYLGAIPILTDVDRETLNIGPEQLAEAATRNPDAAAVMPVHVGGLPCDMSAIRSIAEQHDLAVVEDAAHALSSQYSGHLVGSESDFAVFSFYATKNITTGEGGMVVVSDPERAQHVRTMSFHGIDRVVHDRYRSPLPSWKFDVIAPGFKYNMSDIAAAIGIHQLRKATAFLKRRTAIADHYLHAFADLPIQLPHPGGNGDTHAWHLFTARLGGAIAKRRDEVIARLSDAGIGTSVIFTPLHLHTYWSKLTGLEPTDLPIAFESFERTVNLPIYPAMTDAQVDRVVHSLRSIIREMTS